MLKRFIKLIFFGLLLLSSNFLKAGNPKVADIHNGCNTTVNFTLLEASPFSGSYSVTAVSGEVVSLNTNQRVGTVNITDGVNVYVVNINSTLNHVALGNSIVTISVSSDDDGDLGIWIVDDNQQK